MHRTLPLFFACLLLSASLAADHRIVCLGTPPALSVEPQPEPQKLSDLAQLSSLTKVDYGTDRLLMPYFEVNTNSASGTTSLYAVRNVTDNALSLTAEYFDVFGNFQVANIFNMPAKDTLTVNVRDVLGLGTDPDGFKRGYVVISADEPAPPVPARTPGSDDPAAGDKGAIVLPLPETPSLLVGDYFQLIPGEDFATGDRLLDLSIFSNYFSLCVELETRLFDGGAFSGGTDLIFFHNNPRGAGEFDPPSFGVSVYDEDGNQQAGCTVLTDQQVLLLNSQDFPVPAAGTLEVEVLDGLGSLISEFNALGRFSVGMRAACKRAALQM